MLDHIHEALTPGGLLVAVEWARERFDEPTARWCFARLAPSGDDAEPGWLHRHRDRWTDSGRPWQEYLRSWAAEEGLHTGEQILAGLDARFRRRLCTVGPYLFTDLADTTEADEQAAIDHADIQANGRSRQSPPRHRPRGTATACAPLCRTTRHRTAGARPWPRTAPPPGRGGIEPKSDRLPSWLDLTVPDDRFVASSLLLQSAHPGSALYVATSDINLQTKLSAVGLPFIELRPSRSRGHAKVLRWSSGRAVAPVGDLRPSACACWPREWLSQPDRLC